MIALNAKTFLDIGASQSFRSEFARVKSLHSLPKTKSIQVGNGQYLNVFFELPVILDIHVNRFEVYTLFSEIHENVDLVLGIKNIFGIEGTINSSKSSFNFLYRPIPFSQKNKILTQRE